MADRTAAEMYRTARRLAKRLWPYGDAFRDPERGWTGDRCCAGRVRSDGVRIVDVRGADWWQVVKLLQERLAA